MSSSQAASGLPGASAPKLLIESESASRVFFRNLADTVFPRRALRQSQHSEAAAFWEDVFVSRGLPWWRFLESFAIHVLVIAGLWSASRVWLLRPQALPAPTFSRRDVIFFPASEYLQPLDTGSKTVRIVQKGDPEFSRQTILSVPPEADNHTQTVVTPPQIKLKNDIPLPNVVAWNAVNPAVPISAVSGLRLPAQQPSAIVAPPPVVEQAAQRRRLDLPANAVIAPPPDVPVAASVHMVVTPQAAIVEPPPVVQEPIRHVGEINIGHSEIVPPAPQLPTSVQRSRPYRGETATGTLALGIVPPPPGTAASELRTRSGARPAPDIIPPPPAIAGSDHAKNRIVALGLHPVAGAPPTAAGNRRGTFALSPSGKPGAAGTPDIKASVHAGERRGGDGGAGLRSDLPPGLVVKVGPDSSPTAEEGTNSSTSNPLVAEAKPPLRVAPARRAMASTSAASTEEREVFGNRKFYSMILNMPNLNSAGGSWVIRFAELKDSAQKGDLMAPEATRKVDPAYPLELMRTQIEGRVTLYAVIRSDGTVGDVRVLNSVDDRLDEYARAALSRWHFRPATKAGSAVDLEAVVTIPFRARPAF